MMLTAKEQNMLAQLFCDTYREELLYDLVDKMWYQWDGKCWAKTNMRNINKLFDQLFERMQLNAIKEPKNSNYQMLKVLSSADTMRSKEQILNAAIQLGMTINPANFDAFPNLLNVRNGVIDLVHGSIQPHRNHLLMTMMADVTFDPQATCPRWMQFLEEITQGDAELQRYLQCMVGYCLTGETSEQCAFIVYGSGCNGKTLFLDTIRSLMGDYECNMEFKVLMETNEISTILRRDDNVFPYIRVIPLFAHISAGQIDRKLGEKLPAERSGILNWALEGARLWYAQGLPACAAVDAVTKDDQDAQ